MPTNDDKLSRFSALSALLGVLVLLFIAGQPNQPTSQAAPRPALAATPRLIVVVQTAAPEPTPIPAPTATAAPAPEPIVVVQYVEVPVVVPATVAPPTPFPTVSHTRIEGWVEMERPPVFEAQPVRRPSDMPEGVKP